MHVSTRVRFAVHSGRTKFWTPLAAKADIWTTTMTGERIFPYQWMHRTRGRSSRQTGVGWPHFPNSVGCIIITNDWQLDSARIAVLSSGARRVFGTDRRFDPGSPERYLAVRIWLSWTNEENRTECLH